MSMFTLAISCLTTSNLPWFMDLTFQVPIQYCSFQLWTLLSPPDTSTAECHFLFGPATWFFLELLGIVLYSSPVADWTPSDLEDLSSGIISFCLFILFIGFSRQRYWSGCHFLLQWILFCQNSSLWPIHLGWPCTAWPIASLSYTNPFAMTRLWSYRKS